MCTLKNQSSTVRIIVIDYDRVELLLGKAAQRVGISAALHPEAKARQHGSEYVRGLFVFANQKRLKCHKRTLPQNI